jgi:anti-sigma regulatory factor (Ser/Thr protein kinase)
MDRVEARIVNRLEEISRVADMVERFGAEHEFPGEAVNDVNIALDEALSNIISYGYDPGQESEIVVRLTHQPGEVHVEIEDPASRSTRCKRRLPISTSRRRNVR